MTDKKTFWKIMDYYRGISNVWKKDKGNWVLKYKVKVNLQK